MAKRPARLEVEGLREFNRAVRKSTDRGLKKRIGQSNKEIGRLIISKLKPRPVPQAVGSGAGAAVRPSATAREVVLRVGGKHRTHPPFQQWGRTHVSSAGGAPPRPFILGTAQDHRKEIEEAYLDGIATAMRPAFHKTEVS